MKKTVLSAMIFTLPVLSFANSTTASQASLDLSAMGVGHVLQGSSEVLASAGILTITAVQVSGDFLMVTLRAAKSAASTTIRVSRHAVGHLSLAAGQLVQVSMTGSGYILQESGKVLAFIPNSIGKAMLFNEFV